MKAARIALAAMAFLFPVSTFGAEPAPAPDSPSAAFVFTDPDPAFIIYLETPEVPASDVQDYLNGLDQFLHLFENQDKAGARQVLTSLAANTKLDGGLCDELGHRINATMAILKKRDIVQKNDQELQSSLMKPNLSPDDVADALRKQTEAARNQNSAADPVAPDSPLSTHLTENYLKDTQTREEIAANDRNYLLLVDQCRSDFESYIAALEAAGHDRQVPLAAACYRWLFPESDNPQIKAALIRCRDKTVSLDQIIATVQEENTRHHLLAVAGDLETAYRASPNDPRLLGIALTLKRPVLVFIFEEEKLRTAMQAKDPDACEKLLSEMAGQASDFDSHSIQAFAKAIREKSQLLVSQAKSEMEQGHIALALEAFQAASIVWPGNPALRSGAINPILRQQSKLESLQKFDLYWTQGDYGSLSLHAQEFASYLDDDARRQEELTQAQEKVHAANLAIEQATTLQASGQGAQAWETLEIASRSWPANGRLNDLKLVVAPTAADFVHAIGQAEESEKRNDLGLSLSWYAVAQSYATQSQLAREGIDRMAGKILH